MDVFATLLTGRSAGAIAVILLYGPDAARALPALTRSPRADATLPGGGGRVVRTNLLSADGAVIDDALVVCIGADRYELHVHGGVAVVDAVLERLRELGARVVPPEDAPAALGAGLEGELLLALPAALTPTGLQLLLAQPRVWPAWAARWTAWLQTPAAPRALWQLHSVAQWILQRWRTLRHLFEPARVAIIGRPNAGKSTLANALLGRPVSITSPQAGTTRDWVDAQAIFAATAPRGGSVQVPITLVDTAGVRDTPDALEQESIARTHCQAAQADVIIFLADASRVPEPADLALLDALQGRPLVLACNKCDMGAVPAAWAAGGALPISAKTHAGLPDLMAAVLRRLDLLDVREECLAFSVHRQALLLRLSACDDVRRCAELLAALAGIATAGRVQ